VGGVCDGRVLRHKWVKFGRLAHIVFTVVPYALLLAAFTAAYHVRASEIHADNPEQDPATQRLQVHAHAVKAAAHTYLRKCLQWRLACFVRE
jgi:hypothetical protein